MSWSGRGAISATSRATRWSKAWRTGWSGCVRRPEAAVALDRPKSLREMAADRIRAAIIDADFAFGELLSENALAEMLGISKTPIHEALMQLQSEGLVEILPQRGARVYSPTRESVVDLCDYRLLIETRAVQLACAREPTELIAGLEEIVARMRKAWEAQRVREYLHLDTAYHEQFYLHSGSPSLLAGYGLIAARAAAVRTHLVVPQPGFRRTAYEEHLQMPALLRQGRIADVV